MTLRPTSLLVRWLWPACLIALTLVLWQHRFIAIPHQLNGDAGFSKHLAGWETVAGSKGFSTSTGTPTARFSVKPTQGEYRHATRWLGKIDDVRFLKVAADVQWTDAERGRQPWATPRLVLIGKTPDGKLQYPRDHAAFLAKGTRPWHRVEVVYELPPGLKEVGITFQTLGNNGVLEARSLTVSAVRQRAWFPAATVALLAAWLVWLTTWIRRGGSALWRGIAAGILLIMAAWYLILPGARMRYQPLVGPFQTGHVETPTAPPRPTLPPRKPPSPSAPSAQPEQPAPTPPTAQKPKPAAPTPPPEARQKPVISERLRQIDARIHFIHVLIFTLISLAAFITTGNLRTRSLLVVMAVLSELVSDWHNRDIDWGDLMDLLWNLAGIAFGTGIFALGSHLWSKRQSATAHPRRPPPTA